VGMDLSGGGTERFSNRSWCKMLELAYEYGWQPAGTEPGQWCDPETGELVEQMSPDPDEWNGGYLSNDNQWVTEEDAANIAEALERALENEPDFSDEGRQWFRDFIAFCRAGAFKIA
jgi:hypothetical protein